ncbi:MAG: phenazine antibiotic biosynthesis protein, partial [Pseudonocardiaceae bacterium]
MSRVTQPVLDVPFNTRPDPDEFIRAAMEWHFNPDTGSPYWLKRAKTLEFDPRTDVKGHEDLKLFPNIVNELRDVRAQDLIPQGYGPAPEVIGVF